MNCAPSTPQWLHKEKTNEQARATSVADSSPIPIGFTRVHMHEYGLACYRRALEDSMTDQPNRNFPAANMTLRDHFAGMAMQGDIAGVYSGLPLDMTDEALDKISTLYYRMADAMLRARNVKG